MMDPCDTLGHGSFDTRSIYYALLSFAVRRM